MLQEAHLTKSQRMWICARLFCESDSEATRAVGLGQATAPRWLEDPQFRELVEAVKTLPVEVSLAAIQYLAPKAVVKLEGLLDDENPFVRTQAIKLVFNATKILEGNAPTQQVLVQMFHGDSRPGGDIHPVLVSGGSPQLAEAVEGVEVGTGDWEG